MVSLGNLLLPTYPTPINVIIEDTVNENLLFVGTDNGLYASLNQGASWDAFQNGMPNSSPYMTS